MSFKGLIYFFYETMNKYVLKHNINSNLTLLLRIIVNFESFMTFFTDIFIHTR